MRDRRHPVHIFARLLVALLCLVEAAAGNAEIDVPSDLAPAFAREVTPRLQIPADQQRAYAAEMEDELKDAGLLPLPDQYLVVVDRDPNVQAAMLFWRASTGAVIFIGAAPASTGGHGGFEHFVTPSGVFDHSLENPDFRAEGTTNELGVRGYGAKGMRVYDFGWVEAQRTWGKAGESPMRLQMHSTDPVLLEPRLGTAQSKGCIRIPASLNDFFDRYGILDAAYEQALAQGRKFWVLDPDRTPTRWSGRYLVVVDSMTPTRPPWSPVPRRR
ncbi:MAG TPA: murein L,D-transpeptidase [Burkholderiaceae bacterium]|nr:murein L,D-transpeptidase [Burkholderiaceae bacterium]